MQHGGSVLNPNSQPKTTRNTLPVHLLQNNSGKFVVFAFGRCSRHFIVVFKKENFVCSPRRFTASDFIATKPTQTQATTGFTHLHTPGQLVILYTLVILYFVLYRNNQIYKKGQSQRLKWLGQHNNNRGLLKEQTGLTNLQN